MVSSFTGVAGITRVLPTQAKVVNGDDFYANPGDRSGCVAFVFIEHEVEARKSFAGDNPGYKKISSDVALVLMFRHSGESNDSTTLDATDEAIGDYDDLIEAIKEHIRTNRTLGGAVFQIGEGDTKQGDDVVIDSDLPVQDNEGLISIWGSVRFKVIEFTDPS